MKPSCALHAAWSNVSTPRSRGVLLPTAVALLLALAPGQGLAAGVLATGGNTTNDIGGYRIHTFTSDGSFNVSAGGSVDVLVVAGGGGGAGANGNGAGGGGGAGGLIYTAAHAVVFNDEIAVTVGNGGAGGNTSSATDRTGANGQNK